MEGTWGLWLAVDDRLQQRVSHIPKSDRSKVRASTRHTSVASHSLKPSIQPT